MKLDRRTIPYRILANGLQIVGLIIFSVVTSASSGGSILSRVGLVAVLVVLGIGLGVGWEIARFRRIDYELTADTFDLNSGVLSRREREIPYHRIQNVDIGQNIVQRAFGIAEVSLETAGGGSTEAQLRYVSREEADRLQDELSRRKRGADATAEGESEATAEVGETLFELSDREHLVLGMVSADFRFLGALSVLAPILAPQLAGAIAPEADLLLLFGPAIALAGLVAFWVLSGFLQILRYYDFELTRRGDELRYERGLLQRYNGTVPLSKIQTVSVQENVLARLLGYASVVIQTAGYAPGQDGSQVESAVPIAKRDRAFSLARAVEPFGEVTFERPPTRARTRYAARYTIGLAVLVGVLWLVNAITGLLPLWYTPLVALVLVPVAAHLKWKHLGYYTDGEHVVTRRGFWRRQTIVVPYDRVQVVFSSQTVFQRRRRLGTLTIDTAGGGGFASGDAVALDIDKTVAESLREDVAGNLQRALRTQ
ncbi:PH domain-containing protein [Salinibaculum rarum]|uniref:PH domain-containing protein n=1 Tax=Salinibaculum rarum TaxID=3058903 RepID=UPI00265F50CC|nr:PH domain-containing protein [Salinibaculum sp. KK48]